jgi:anaerobic magnesium-protoporphyrin IX monomethyl ester cyclase
MAYKVLLIKPHWEMQGTILHPLGLLYIAQALRKHFAERVAIEILDMRRRRLPAEWLAGYLEECRPDVVGITALNHEARVAHRLAEIAKQWNSDCLTVLGGPYALHQSKVVFENGEEFDWVIEGAGDRNFPQALERYLAGDELGNDIPGFSHRGREEQEQNITTTVDVIKDLDEYAMPAWDLAEFDAYRWVPTPNPFMRPGRYATIFTSRGCPYSCSYCHDIFTKKIYFRSVESVLEEIALLHEKYGVDEFMVLDDIFNLHKPRLKKIMSEVKRRWGGKLRFSFMNGLRADILDKEVIDALKEGGTYIVSVAIETASPRLQQLIGKRLDIEKARRSIELLEKSGISVLGFFMLGFPTETPEEIQSTIQFALESPLTMAAFLTVVPQSGTRLFEWAEREGGGNMNRFVLGYDTERNGRPYRSRASWYEMTYGYPLYKDVISTTWRFYFLSPRRLLKLLRRWPIMAIIKNTNVIISWLNRS